MNVSVVIPNYNGEELLKENLPVVINAAKQYTLSTHHSVEIIVTDDGSTDTSREVVSGISGTIQFLEHKKNTGFAGNVNRGVRQATGEIIVLLNTDVRPQKNFLLPLLTHFTADDVFAVGCLEEAERDGKVFQKGRGVGTWQKGFLIHSAGEINGTETLWASGGSSAYRHALWKKLGGMDELFSPFYWEDIDLSYRAWKAGYRVLFEKQSVVTHEHEKGAIRTGETRKHIKKVAYRNQFLFAWKNMTSGDLLFTHVLWLPYHLLSAVKRGDSAFFAGLFRAVVFLPAILKKRRTLLPEKRSDDDVTQSIV